MIKKTKTTLPNDFDVTKYDALEFYDVTQWYRELLWRYRLYKMLDNNKDKVVAHFQKHVDTLGTFEQFIFDYPLKADSTFQNIESAKFFYTNPHYQIFEDELERLKKTYSTHQNPYACITPFTVGDFTRLVDAANLHRLLDYEVEDYDEVNDVVVSGLSAMELKAMSETGITEPQKAPLDSILYDKSKAIINVDFSRSNDELKSAFEVFVKEYRDIIINRVEHKYSLDAEFDPNKFSKWQRQYQIIPRIDLLLWLKFNGFEYTFESLCEMFEAKSPDQVRRTIMPWIEGLLTPTALQSLRRQIG